MTTYLTQFMSQPTTIQPQGVPGAKLFVTTRSFFISILGRSHHPQSCEYKIASDNADILYDVYQITEQCLNRRHLPILSTANTWISYYVYDIRMLLPSPPRPITTIHQSRKNSLYCVRTRTHSTIAKRHIHTKEVPYIISEYLRDLMYLNHTVTVIAPKWCTKMLLGEKSTVLWTAFSLRNPGM